MIIQYRGAIIDLEKLRALAFGAEQHYLDTTDRERELRVALQDALVARTAYEVALSEALDAWESDIRQSFHECASCNFEDWRKDDQARIAELRKLVKP